MNRNTITRQITTTEENIRRLMESLEENDTRTDELANCQNKVDKLFGKLNENHSELTADVKEMLDNLRAGRVSPDDLEKLLVSEREKVSYSLQLADHAKKSLEDVMSFVQHFVTDVQKGKAVPKDSFTSLYNELDAISDSMNSMAKVHRSKDIQKLKRILQTHIDEKQNVNMNEGVVSLKHILHENNRETKERQQRLSQGNNRTTVKPIGSLGKSSNRDLAGTELGSSHRLGSPDRRESLASRGGGDHSRSPTNKFPGGPPGRSGTAGSMGGSLGPTSPGKGGFGFDKTGMSVMLADDMETDALSLQGKHSSISKSIKKTKKSGKKEKRLSSAIIYQHTDDDLSVGSSGGLSLTSTGPIALADFIPADTKKLLVSQGVQTDDVAIEFNKLSSASNSTVELHEEGMEQDLQQSSSASSGMKGGKKSAGGKRKKDGKTPNTISMVSARRGSRDKSKSGVATGSRGISPSTKEGQGEPLLSPGSGGAATQEYFQNYVDKPSTNHTSIVKENENEVRLMQEAEDEKVAGMSSEEVKQFLNKKEQRLLLLDAKLRQQQADMDAVIAVKVAEEVAKTQQKQETKTEQWYVHYIFIELNCVVTLLFCILIFAFIYLSTQIICLSTQIT